MFLQYFYITQLRPYFHHCRTQRNRDVRYLEAHQKCEYQFEIPHTL